MPDERLLKRRLPAHERSVKEINPELDVRVRLLGTVIDKSTNSVVLDDGSGRIEVLFEEPPYVEQGQLVRIVTRVMPLIDGFECKGEAVQVLEDDFDINLYKRTRSMVKYV